MKNTPEYRITTVCAKLNEKNCNWKDTGAGKPMYINELMFAQKDDKNEINRIYDIRFIYI